MKKLTIIFALFLLLFGAKRSYAKPTIENIDASIAKEQWNDAAEMAFELITEEKRSGKVNNTVILKAAQKGSYALFKKGYSNSALLLLKQVPQNLWNQSEEGAKELVQILSMFQKKVPMTLLPARMEQLSLNDSTSNFKDETLFAKGRAAFEQKKYKDAEGFLNSVSAGSRYFGPSKYLLGTIATEDKDYKTAEAKFSEVFQSQVLGEQTEFWDDLTTEVNTNGANVRLSMDAESLSQNKKAAEMALIALARTAYAQGFFESAAERYLKIAPQSMYYAQARLERIWSLFAMGKNELAQSEAAALSLDESHFHSVQSRIIRAIALTESSRTQEARAELRDFLAVYEKTKTRVMEFQTHKTTNLLPTFLKNDLLADERIRMLEQHEKSLSVEIVALQKEDNRLFPIYTYLSSDLQPLRSETKRLVEQIRDSITVKRLRDLEELKNESYLVYAETYLEDRELLRKSIHLVSNGDELMADFLEKAIDDQNKYMKLSQKRNMQLEFRNAELLWELASLKLILKKPESEAMALKSKALEIATEIADHHPEFQRHSEAMFFRGFALMELGDEVKGIQQLRQFVAKYPQAAHADDAQRILGDAAFDKNDFNTAEFHFKKVLEFPESPVVGYAYYKIGWCNYNRKQFAKSLLGLEKAVFWALNQNQPNSLITLKTEARRDLISVYAEVGNHLRAIDYFSQFFRNDDASTWILDLAKELETMGQFEKTSDLYRQLMALSPDSTDSIKFLLGAIEGSYKLRKWPDVLKQTEELMQRFDIEFKKPRELASKHVIEAEALLRDIITTAHSEFRRTDTAEDLSKVARLDEVYLNTFHITVKTEDEKTKLVWPEIQMPLYLHGLLQHKIKKPVDSMDTLKKHWNYFQAELKEPLKEENLRNLVYSIANAIEVSEKTSQDLYLNDLVQYSTHYLTLYPSHSKKRELAFLASSVLFKANRTDDALKSSEILFLENPNDDTGSKSFKNIKVSLYNSKNWKKAYEVSNHLFEVTKDEKYKNELRQIREETRFMQAEAIEDAKESADLFLSITADPEMKTLKDKSLYNAFMKLYKANMPLEALAVANRLEKEFPKFDGLLQIAGLRAALYQEAGDYQKSLPLLVDFIEKDKSAPKDIKDLAIKNKKLIEDAMASDPASKGRSIASVQAADKSSDTKLVELERERKNFSKNALVKKADLAETIKLSLSQFEKILSRHGAVAEDTKVSHGVAFEAFCAIPSLYETITNSLEDLNSKQDAATQAEIAKIIDPLKVKLADSASQCISKAMEARHNGPEYQKVLVKHGWRKDHDLDNKVALLLNRLTGSQKLWIDPATTSNEDEIITNHIQSKGGEDKSWYGLALKRLETQKKGLARLTLIDAYKKYPDNGQIMNALGAIDEDYAMLEKAATKGSTSAFVNMAIMDLKSFRLPQAKAALKEALERGRFEDQSEIKNLIQEVVN